MCELNKCGFFTTFRRLSFFQFFMCSLYYFYFLCVILWHCLREADASAELTG